MYFDVAGKPNFFFVHWEYIHVIHNNKILHSTGKEAHLKAFFEHLTKFAWQNLSADMLTFTKEIFRIESSFCPVLHI